MRKALWTAALTALMVGCSSGGSSSSSSTSGSSTSSTGTSTNSNATGSGSGSSGSNGNTNGSSSSSTGTTTASSSGSTTSNGSSSGSSGTTGALTLDAACTGAAQAVCAYAQRCQLIDPAITDCAGLINANEICPPLIRSSVSDGSLTVSPNATQLVAGLAALLGDAGCDGTTLGANPLSVDFEGLVTGAVPVGGTCTFSQQCAVFADGGTPYCTAGEFGCGTGTCAYTGSANLGDECLDATCAQGYCDYSDIPDGGEVCEPLVGVDSPCPQGNECDPTQGFCDFSGLCTALLGDGGSCSDSSNCAPGLTCLNYTTCGPQGGEGQPCAIGSDCQNGLNCDVVADGGNQCTAPIPDGGACDPTASLCDLEDTCFLGACQPFTANPGESCGNDPSGFGGRYCNTGFCNNPDGGPGTCVGYGGLADSCSGDDAGSGTCVYDYDCINGHCIQRARAGNVCQSSYDCATFEVCANGTCVAQVGLGDACSASNVDQCSYSVCGAGNTCQSLVLDDPCDQSAAGLENNGGCEPDLSCNYVDDGGATCQVQCFEGGDAKRNAKR